MVGSVKKIDKTLRQKKSRWLIWILPTIGLLALIWFMIRVIPKPSRAMYPCQRTAFPLASSFVIWLAGAVCSIVAFRRAKRCFAQSRHILCVILIAASVGLIWLVLGVTIETKLRDDELTSNAPIGIAKGVHPGRVVWAHNPDATDWDGPGNGYWWENTHTNQAVVNQMMSMAIRALSDN